MKVFLDFHLRIGLNHIRGVSWFFEQIAKLYRNIYLILALKHGLNKEGSLGIHAGACQSAEGNLFPGVTLSPSPPRIPRLPPLPPRIPRPPSPPQNPPAPPLPSRAVWRGPRFLNSSSRESSHQIGYRETSCSKIG